MTATSRNLEIRGGAVSAGGMEVAFRPDDPRSLVDAHFRLVPRLRDIDDEQIAVPVRSGDLHSIVDHLRRRHSSHNDRATGDLIERVLEMATMETRVVVGAIFAGAVALELAACWTDGPDAPLALTPAHVEPAHAHR